jgi:hypothetical protein
MNLAAIDISDYYAPSILIGNCVPNRDFVQQFCVSAAVSLFAQSICLAIWRIAYSAFGMRFGFTRLLKLLLRLEERFSRDPFKGDGPLPATVGEVVKTFEGCCSSDPRDGRGAA